MCATIASGEEYVVSSCWVMAAQKGEHCLSDLCQKQGHFRGATDTCFQGSAVCGKRRFQQLLEGCKLLDVTVKRVACSSNMYRFGTIVRLTFVH